MHVSSQNQIATDRVEKKSNSQAQATEDVLDCLSLLGLTIAHLHLKVLLIYNTLLGAHVVGSSSTPK